MRDHDTINDARNYVTTLPQGTDISALLISLIDAPLHPLFEGKRVLRRETQNSTSLGPSPRRGPRTYYMSCSKDDLYDALCDENVSSVFGSLTVAAYVMPATKQDS
jgi:hypothetical protein